MCVCVWGGGGGVYRINTAVSSMSKIPDLSHHHSFCDIGGSIQYVKLTGCNWMRLSETYELHLV